MLTLLASLALGSEIYVAVEIKAQTGLPEVAIYLGDEGTKLNDNYPVFVARKLDAGSHSVVARNAFSKALATLEVSLDADEVATLVWRNGGLHLLGSEPSPLTVADFVSREYGEVQISVGGKEVMVMVDGAPVDRDPGGSYGVAPQALAGTHTVAIRNMTMKKVAEIDVDVPGGHIVQLSYDDKALTVHGAAPKGTPPEELPGASTFAIHAANAEMWDGAVGMAAGATREPGASAKMESARFDKLLARIGTAPTSDQRLDIIRGAASRNQFVCNQVGALMDTVAAKDRVKVVRITKKSLLNKGKWEVLLDHVSTKEDKGAIRELFRS